MMLSKLALCCIGCVAIILFAVLFVGNRSDGNRGAYMDLGVRDFGLLTDDSKKPVFTFSLRNEDSVAWTVSKHWVSCGCLRVLAFNERTNPGEAFEVSVELDPRGQEGRQRRFVSFEITERTAVIRATIIGFIAPVISLEPPAIQNSVPHGQSASFAHTVTLKLYWPKSTPTVRAKPQSSYLRVTETDRMAVENGHVFVFEVSGLIPEHGRRHFSDYVEFEATAGEKTECRYLHVSTLWRATMWPSPRRALVLRSKGDQGATRIRLPLNSVRSAENCKFWTSPAKAAACSLNKQADAVDVTIPSSTSGFTLHIEASEAEHHEIELAVVRQEAN